MTQINVASEFGRALGGRYVSDGPYSGELFRQNKLLPTVQAALGSGQKVIVNFDGVSGMPTSFLEEAFGGLVRKLPEVQGASILAAVEVVAPTSPRLWPFCRLAIEYMQTAVQRRG